MTDSVHKAAPCEHGECFGGACIYVHSAAPILEQGSQWGRREGGDAAPLAEGSDRELLERAAEAAGFDHVSVHADGMTYGHDGICNPIRWNPLTDDGDALRLAVKLRIAIRRDDPSAVCAGWSAEQSGAPTRDGRGPWYWKEWLRDQQDDCEATRRAIVQAAAMLASAK